MSSPHLTVHLPAEWRPQGTGLGGDIDNHTTRAGETSSHGCGSFLLSSVDTSFVMSGSRSRQGGRGSLARTWGPME